MSTNLTKPLRLRNDGGAQLQLERSSTVRSLTVNASGNVELDGTLVPNALTTATATITGGSINGTTVGATTPGSGAFTTLAASSTATLNILASSGATITGGSINGTPIGATTASTGAFTNLSATTITGPLTGNADTATKLSSVRTFALTGDVTGSVSSDLTAGASIASSIASGVVTNAMVATNAGIVDTKLATISTAGKVANSATTADSANTASAIVARDTNGNFSAATITAALTGNADTSTKLSSSRTFALTGDVTGSVSSDLTAGASIASTIANDAVTNAKVSPTAAIAYSKLALTGSIVDADIATAAAIVDTKLATIATAGKVSNSATTATASNTNSAIVARDASGNFSAATITATLSGNATTATTADKVANALTAGTFLTATGTFDGSTARTFAVDATDANTASKVVARDGSGNFSAGTISAALSGAVTSSSATITGGSINGTTVGATTASTGAFTTLTASSTATLNTLSSSGATITGGSINGTTIGATTASTGAFTSITASGTITGTVAYTNTASGLTATTVQTAIDEVAARVPVGQFSWDNTSTTTPVAKPQVTPTADLLASIHDRMRGCVLLDNGNVNYYLNPTDWTQKADGSASVLTGADGMVMVEIPKFYVRNASAGSIWKPLISATPLAGYDVHPAFVKDGAEVPYRYYSAYDAAAISGSTVIETDNADNQSSRVNTGTDKLISVSGVYPMAGLTRNEFRLLAANRGTGWRIGDYALWSAIGLLLSVEAQTLQSQGTYGVGNTRHTTWPAGGTFSVNNRTVQSGAGNSIGNGSGGLATGTIDTSNNGDFVKYRGIENFWGNVNNWTDGIVLYSEGNTAGNKVFAYWNNNTSQFADVANADPSTSIPTGYSLLGEFANSFAATRYATQFDATTTWAKVVTAVSTTSSHGTNDFYFTNSGWRVLLVGGDADIGANAGAFTFNGSVGSTSRDRTRGARLAF